MSIRHLVLLVAFCIACGRAEGAREVTIRFWAMGAEGEQVAKLIPQFEREHPGIRVRVQQIQARVGWNGIASSTQDQNKS